MEASPRALILLVYSRGRSRLSALVRLICAGALLPAARAARQQAVAAA